MAGFPQSGDRSPSPDGREEATSGNHFPTTVGGKLNPSRALEEPELEAALQLLVERAQYITGATGTALALPHGGEMICRASAGSCAPAVGARLQVRSGLTGESIARRQLLRCDHAEADPRVNIEACRALGISSIVVLPLLRRNGEVRGLFELFSDHPYAFEERDLVALERMADLTLTALDLAEQRHGAIPPPSPKQMETQPRSKPASPATNVSAPVVNLSPRSMEPLASVPSPSAAAAAAPALDVNSALQAPAPDREAMTEATPEAMQRVQKCAACGFPVSEGRTFCIDCEKKLDAQREQTHDLIQHPIAASSEEPAPAPEDALPPFLANAVPVKESWLSDHLNLLAIVVLILGVLVAFVIFR